MTLRVTPADCSTEVTVKDENKQKVFSGSAQEFAAYRFTTPGSYTTKLVVSSGEGYQSEPTVSGHQTYEFTFDVTIKATVRLNTQAVTPGGVVAVKVTGQQTDTKPSLTAELPDTGFRASATGDGWVAYLAVPLETEPGSYTIKVTVDGEVQELTLNVSKSAASFGIILPSPGWSHRMSARMIPRRRCWTCWIRHRIPSTGRTLGLLRRSAIRWRSPCRMA